MTTAAYRETPVKVRIMSDPLALARIRAQRSIPAPARETDLTALRIAAQRAGRQLLDVPEHGGGRRFLLGWPDDIDAPAATGAREDGARQVTPSVLLVLAACLGCCWPSGQDGPYPGLSVPETEILEALDRFTQGPGTPRPVAGGTRAARSRALRLLRATGFLEPGGDDGRVRLGPEIAAWSDRDIQRLRDRFEDLPGVQGGVS
jgi:hypothetical protein